MLVEINGFQTGSGALSTFSTDVSDVHQCCHILCVRAQKAGLTTVCRLSNVLFTVGLGDKVKNIITIKNVNIDINR